MASNAGGLEGRRVLIVEDEYVIAVDLAWSLQEAGIEVVGPAGSVEEALSLIETIGPLDGAVLDINLGREPVYPVADALLQRGVPFVFVTGYDQVAILPAYETVPRYDKPFDRDVLLLMLTPGSRP